MVRIERSVMAKSTKQMHLTYKIVVMGDPYCGKSSIIERCRGGRYDPHYVQTIGHAERKLEIEDNPITLCVYDTAGQTNLVIKSIYRKAQGILLVFDFSRKETLDNIPQWIDLIQMNCAIMPEMVLVGNKVDLQDLKVTSADAKMVAESYNMPFLEVSAKLNYNIETAFQQLSMEIFVNRRTLFPNMNTSILVGGEQKERSNCCT